jgi:membrane-anchored protein YejM (alkaline phosphatase superfamily)
MLNWTNEFYSTYKDVPKYTFNFYTEISHDDFNLVQIADDDIVNWFKILDKANVFNNTIGILMSDHGARFNAMRATLQGMNFSSYSSLF